jgi:hypothetical protein
MAKSELTVNEQVRKLNQEQQAIYRKLQRLAPAGALEYAGTTDADVLTWQSTLGAVGGAADCLEVLAEDSIIHDLIQAEKAEAVKSAATAELQTAGKN